ncbi:MAG: hypothetical protein O8C61_09275 [Candidatus Methanoperedens sp.]|nr:hypothetical protein [Candidatus Methanoperedens sp.]
MKLKSLSNRKRGIAKRTCFAGIGFIGIMLAIGILFIVLPFNGNVASAGSDTSSISAAKTPVQAQTSNVIATNHAELTKKVSGARVGTALPVHKSVAQISGNRTHALNSKIQKKLSGTMVIAVRKSITAPRVQTAAKERPGRSYAKPSVSELRKR